MRKSLVRVLCGLFILCWFFFNLSIRIDWNYSDWSNQVKWNWRLNSASRRKLYGWITMLHRLKKSLCEKIACENNMGLMLQHRFVSTFNDYNRKIASKNSLHAKYSFLYTKKRMNHHHANFHVRNLFCPFATVTVRDEKKMKRLKFLQHLGEHLHSDFFCIVTVE